MGKGKRFGFVVDATATCRKHGHEFPLRGRAPDLEAGRKVRLFGRCPAGHDVVVEHTVP
ncbi:hypothetical protein ACFXPA_44180 [Amycolatopsis sp. NPDC059090]|uniref:hypothetical protein n=1 Tax=unclassified Amycolatopsis TaxID=2618356 RepID=UPI00366C64B3